MTSVLLAFFLVSADVSPVDAVIVAPREFLPALQPLVEHRLRQGHRFVHVPNTGSAAHIKAAVRQRSACGRLKYLLLVGDAEPGVRTNSSAASRSVPTHLHAAKVNVQFGSEPQIASDNWYADLDDDHLPDLAVGRIPADSPAEVSRIVAKILA